MRVIILFNVGNLEYHVIVNNIALLIFNLRVSTMR